MEEFFVAMTKNRLSEHLGLLVIVVAACFVNVDTLILFLTVICAVTPRGVVTEELVFGIVLASLLYVIIGRIDIILA